MELMVDIKIKVCIPYYNEIHPKTLETAMAIVNAYPGSKVQKLGGTYIGKARNAMINDRASQKTFQEIPDKYTHWLFLDSDVYAKDPLAAIKHMLQADYPIIGGLYEMRTNKKAYCAGQFADGRPFGVMGRLVLPGDVKTYVGALSVDWIGAGFLLVKSEVFKKVKYPWFSFRMIEDGDTRDEVGEDVGFCLAAIEAGYFIFAADVGLVHSPWWQQEKNEKSYVDILNKMECDFNRYLDGARSKYMALRKSYEDIIEYKGR
jgi:hypothetical protein